MFDFWIEEVRALPMRLKHINFETCDPYHFILLEWIAMLFHFAALGSIVGGIVLDFRYRQAGKTWTWEIGYYIFGVTLIILNIICFTVLALMCDQK